MGLFAANLDFLLRRDGLDAKQLATQLGITNLQQPLPDELVLLAGHFGMPVEHLLTTSIEARETARSRDIRLLVMDIDGVMTDGGMYYSESGDEYKKFNAKDGFAVRALTKRGVHTGIISHGFNTELIRRRAERLHIQYVEVSQVPKLETLKRWCTELNITTNQVCYIGDDLNDDDILRAVGFSSCPSDAVSAVKSMVHTVLTRKGGEGCIRELIDKYLS
jgi:YrbI family 3-deoxy-D-manno-octulosonate 8-phosphate phosphatase